MRATTQIWTLATVGLMVGCGGVTFSSGIDAGDHDARTNEDGGHVGEDASADAPAPWSPVCPENAPDVGAACALPDSTTCEYGSLQYDVDCDTVLTCQQNVWTKFQTFGTCMPDGPNASACPAAFSDIQQGQSCTTQGARCEYAAGVCTCDLSLGGPIHVGDGGSTPFWSCDPGAGCPMPRPRLGTACSLPADTDCTYNACEYSQTCQGGVWRGEVEACAVAN